MSLVAVGRVLIRLLNQFARPATPEEGLAEELHERPWSVEAGEPRERRSALCLSGGGIRSATFCLGALEGLAHLDLLRRFDYLSTVSGGGYIGSWLTAW